MAHGPFYAQSTTIHTHMSIGFISKPLSSFIFVLFCFVFSFFHGLMMCCWTQGQQGGRYSWLRPNKATTAPRHGSRLSQQLVDRGGLTPVRPSVPYFILFFSISHVHQKSLKLAGRQMEKVTRPWCALLASHSIHAPCNGNGM